MSDLAKKIRIASSAPSAGTYGVWLRDGAAEIERLTAELAEVKAMIAATPIGVYCNGADGATLIARLSCVSDVTPLQEPYDERLTWNMDESREAAKETKP